MVHKLTSMTGKAVASHFKNIMSEYTWSCTIVSDNGLCYVSKEFHELMQQKGVNHILVLPHHPQSNGMAEKYVGIVKQLFLKAREERKDPADALHAYRSTPLDSKTPSPMAILMGRLPHTNLPMSHAAKAKIGHLPLPETVRAKSKVNDVKQHELHLNQPVMHQDVKDKHWYPAKIVQLCPQPRSYISKTQKGARMQRTQQMLKPYKLRTNIKAPWQMDL